MDADNLTAKILCQLEAINLSADITIIVVMGATAPHVNHIRKLAAQSRYTIEVNIAVTHMAELMANADLAIGAAGSTTWERSCLGLPSILLVLADNQYPIAHTLSQLGAVILLNNIADLSLALTTSQHQMLTLSANSASLVDGIGVTRVCSVIEHCV